MNGVAVPEPLLLERRPPAALITLNRPDEWLAAQLYTTEDKAEEMRAFFEKRAPEFRGR